MSSENLQRLFDNFTKIKTNRSMNKDGVGLGLVISKNLARALGGDIQVESQVDIGSTFTVELKINSHM